MHRLSLFNPFFDQSGKEPERSVGRLIGIDFTDYSVNSLWGARIPYAQKVFFHYWPNHSELGQLRCIAG